MSIFYRLAEKTLELQRRGVPLISLNIGDPNLPAPECAVKAAMEGIGKGRSRYVSAAGIPELREKIAERERCTPENVVVGPGSKHLLFGLISLLGGKHGRVIIPSPHYPGYELICRLLKMWPVILRTSFEDRWLFDNVDFDYAKMIIICNPVNPTSIVYPEDLLRKIIKEAAEREVYVIMDEAYKGLSIEPVPDYGAISVKSFSKEFNMGGWRLGYAVAPEEIAERLVNFNLMTTTCVPEFVQRAGIACLENEKEIIEQNRDTWKKRFDIASKALKDAGFKFVRPDAGLYIFATHDKIKDGDEYVFNLLDAGVVVAPGSSFGGYDNFVRICINQDEELLLKAIGIMEACLEKQAVPAE
ncbi:MAG: pyridoxal phosphate-dependent aminotransferase [Chloroflexi bacterium]|nr:pyridoxal phosphate-dependent aminotransferase [Chloroflexota bacterium]